MFRDYIDIMLKDQPSHEACIGIMFKDQPFHEACIDIMCKDQPFHEARAIKLKKVFMGVCAGFFVSLN